MTFQFKTRNLRLLVVTFSLFSVFTVNLINAEESMPFPMIQVSASGNAAVAPDMAVLDLQVERTGKSARKALDVNNAAMKNIIAALGEMGIKDKDIQTSGFNIQPRYNQEKPDLKHGRGPLIIGYVVYNSLVVKVRNLKILGSVLDSTVTLGVNSGGNIRFVNDDPSRTISLARTKAMKNAMAKARTLAKAANVKLGRIISINEGYERPRPVRLAMRSADSASGADFVPLAAGENSYRVTVDLSWEIDQ